MKPSTLAIIHALERTYGYAPPECLEYLDPPTRHDFEEGFFRAVRELAEEGR